jgi:type VI secretion system VasD/TssJ family lipoprotein
VRLVGSERLNVNDHDESSPVKVRIFKLRNPTRFEQASRRELWRLEAAKEAMGDTLVGEIEERDFAVGDPALSITMQPLDESVHWIGLMVLCFNDKEEAGSWRCLVRAEEAERFNFRLREYSIEREER